MGAAMRDQRDIARFQPNPVRLAVDLQLRPALNLHVKDDGGLPPDHDSPRLHHLVQAEEVRPQTDRFQGRRERVVWRLGNDFWIYTH
jgi:hypothetical protein